MPRRKEGFNWSLIMVLFIVLVMAISTIGYLWTGSQDQRTFRYNNYKFTQDSTGFHTEINNVQADFSYPPEALENTTQDYFNRTSATAIKDSLFVYMTSDINDSSREDIALFEYQLTPLLEKQFSIYSQSGFTSLISANLTNIPVIDCRNASNKVLVMYLHSSDVAKTTLDNGCIEVSFTDSQDLLKTRDLLLYLLFGIIK